MSSTRFFVTAAASFVAAVAPSMAIVLSRRMLGPLRAASWLVIYGVVIAMGEHAMWAIRLSWHERRWLNPHSDVHYFMAGAYAAIGGVVLSVVACTLLRQGRRSGWYTVLFACLAGGSLELVMNGPTGILFRHGFSNADSLPQGTFLFGYLFAWLAALTISYLPIFRPTGARGVTAERVSVPGSRH